MTTILEIDGSAWKQAVYDELTNEEVEALKKAIKEAIAAAGFVTGSLYLLPAKEEKRLSGMVPGPVPICSI